ncbi:MAG: hypothetical protein H7Y59_06195 [Anaerolineales bacterium]|nr:hypothetical protein [Anaerolineales bacterium]
MKRELRSIFSFIVLLAAMLACANPLSGTAPASSANVETIVAATFAALTESVTESSATPLATLSTSSLLPHSLYFLNNDAAALAQVYRLDKDGKTVTQLTFEPANVDDYDVSPIDGSVVYVTNNQLFTVNADGSNRSMIVDGGVRDENNPFITNVNNPVWSPNGETIAFGYKGLNFYSIVSGQYNNVLENKINALDGGFSIPEELYWPERYSPDGSKLLITLGYYEGASAAIYYPNGNALIRLNGGEGSLICCDNTKWSADGSVIHAASASTGMFNAGLWRVDPVNGNVTTLLLGSFETNPADVASTPYLGPDGQLYFFYASVPNTGDFISRPSLQLVRSAQDGVTNRTVLNPKIFSTFNEALWAPDASFVITASGQTAEAYYGGVTELYYTDGQKAMVQLLPFAMNLKWGP